MSFTYYVIKNEDLYGKLKNDGSMIDYIESNSLAGRFVGVSIIRPKNANQHFLVCKPFLLLPAIKINKIMSAPLADMKKNFKNWFKLHFLLQSKTIKFSD